MDLRLDGRVALVTGASRGIGKAIARAYAECGARVMLSSRKQDALEAAAGEIGVYDNTKAALIHLTRHLATELGPQVRVNAIAPGLVKTDFARVLWETHGEAMAKLWPLKRLGEPEDVAHAAVFLASDLAS